MFVEGLSNNFPGHGLFEPQNLWNRSTGKLALDAEFLDQFREQLAGFGIEIHANESKVIGDSFLQFEWLDDADHEVDLVENLLQVSTLNSASRLLPEPGRIGSMEVMCW